MANIIESLPQLLDNCFAQQEDLELLKVFVRRFNEEGNKGVKDLIQKIIRDILEKETNGK